MAVIENSNLHGLKNTPSSTATSLKMKYFVMHVSFLVPLLVKFKGGPVHLPPKFEHIFVAVITFFPFFYADTFLSACCLLCVL